MGGVDGTLIVLLLRCSGRLRELALQPGAQAFLELDVGHLEISLS